MKKFSKVLVLGVLALFLLVGNAMATPIIYFAQDDFTLTFGQTGSPGAPGGVFVSDGQIKLYTSNTIVGYYQLAGTDPDGAYYDGNGHYVTEYDNNSFATSLNIYKNSNFTGLMWSSTQGFLETIVNSGGDMYDPPVFNANNYSRPYYESQTEEFSSVGDGWFIGAGVGSNWPWTDPEYAKLTLVWFGTYNWGYDAVNPVDVTLMQGNAQGMLAPVPEPATMLLLGSGLIGLAGYGRRKFFKKG